MGLRDMGAGTTGGGGWGKKCLPYRSNAEQAKNTGWQTNENVPLLQKFTPLTMN